jgi:hypothetical protein
LRASEIKWQLSDDEMTEVKLNWARQVVKKSELLEKKFLSEKQK